MSLPSLSSLSVVEIKNERSLKSAHFPLRYLVYFWTTYFPNYWSHFIKTTKMMSIMMMVRRRKRSRMTVAKMMTMIMMMTAEMMTIVMMLLINQMTICVPTSQMS